MSNSMEVLRLTVNGVLHCLKTGINGDVLPSDTLAYVLREVLGLTGTKTPCNKGECGACTVLLDGKTPILSCSTLAVECDGHHITTIEGVHGEDGGLHPLQQAFLDIDAIQCGMCTPGIIMTSLALLSQNPDPSEKEVRDALAGNICRCTGYEKYAEGVLLAARRMKGGVEI